MTTLPDGSWPYMREHPDKLVLEVVPGHTPSPLPPVRIFLGTGRPTRLGERSLERGAEGNRTGPDVAPQVHAHRAVWSGIHGFLTLEHAGVMRRPASVRESYRRMIGIYADALSPSDGQSRSAFPPNSRA